PPPFRPALDAVLALPERVRPRPRLQVEHPPARPQQRLAVMDPLLSDVTEPHRLRFGVHQHHPAGPGPVCGRAGRLVALVACIDVSLVGPGLLGVRPHAPPVGTGALRSEEHTSELQSRFDLVCRLLLEKKKIKKLLKRQYITA